MILLKSSGWPKGFLGIADPFFDFSLYLLYLNCYFTGFAPNQYTGVASSLFPDRGRSQGRHASQPVFMGTPLNNQAVIVNTIRLLLLLTSENYSHGAYSLT